MNGKEVFLQSLIDIADISTEQAERVYKKYRFLKVLKVDKHGGQISVKHGAFLDKSLIKSTLLDCQ